MTTSNSSPEDERARLVDVDRLTSDLESGSDPVLNSIVAMVSSYFKVPTSLVSIIERDYQVFKARVGMEPERTSREISFCAHSLDEGGMLEICDPVADPRFLSNPLVIGAPFIRYYAGAPLTINSGRNLGRLCVLDYKAHAPMDEQGRTLLRNAAQVVVARLESMHRSHYIDPMTGLPNRQRFEADILQAPDQHERVAVLIEPLSASGMDSLAKSLGSEFFTNFMLAVKELVLKLLPAETRVYRSGTLGFVALLNHRTLSLSSLADSIVHAFERPLYCVDIPVFSDVGICVLPLKRESGPPTDILRLMSSITDAARRSERRWLDYDPAIDSSLRRSTVLLNDIEAALGTVD
ncbi:MAG: diguanylate cyclase, partial [Oxalobacteraceae bacterium]